MLRKPFAGGWGAWEGEAAGRGGVGRALLTLFCPAGRRGPKRQLEQHSWGPERRGPHPARGL